MCNLVAFWFLPLIFFSLNDEMGKTHTSESYKRNVNVVCLLFFFPLVSFYLFSEQDWFSLVNSKPGGYSHTLPIRVCAAQRSRDFEAPDLERGIHFRGVF